MKKVLLCRHAKSSWANSELTDWERPLNKRGEKDIPQMSKIWLAKESMPEIIIYSPSVRTKATAKGIADNWNFTGECRQMDNLYHASQEDLLAVLENLSEDFNYVMIIAHNPGITDFFNDYTLLQIDNVPTCAMGLCTLEVNLWQEVRGKKWLVNHFLSPKLI